MKKLITYLFFSISLLSCQKNKLENFNDYTTLSLPEKNNVRNTFFISENIGFAVGGKRFSKGYLYKTTDGGISWNLKLDVNDHNLYTIYFMDSLNGIACGEAMFYFYTTDGGETWNRRYMWPKMPQLEKDMADFKNIHQYNDTTLFLVAGDDYNEGVFFKINNQHKNWSFEEKKHELRGVTSYNEKVFTCGYGYVGEYHFNIDSVIQLQEKGDFYIGIHAFSETELIMATNQGKFLKSYNGGITWKVSDKKSRLSPKRWILNDMLFINNNEGIAIGNYGLLLYTNDGGENWKEYRLSKEKMFFSVFYQSNTLYLSANNGEIIKIGLSKLRE